MSTVCILGSGPAGLFAAQAIKLSGHDVCIFSLKKKSTIYGAQFLHRPIPELTELGAGENIVTVRPGEERHYAKRVYGDHEVETSWSKMPETQMGWNLRQTYDAAWDKFNSNIADMNLDSEDVKGLSANFELVISTIPLWSICHGNHKFDSVPIMARSPGDPWLALKHKNFILYNGFEEGYWYRSSRMFGESSTEAIIDQKTIDKQRGTWEIGYKVVGTNCDCHPAVVRAGRHGLWQRGILTHHAFETAIEAVNNTFGGSHASRSDVQV